MAATAAALVGAFLTVGPHPVSAGESESIEGSDPIPAARIVWLSGQILRSDSVAVPVGEDGFFVCLRPPGAPRARPEEIRFQGREFEIDLLASDRTTGLCLLKIPTRANTGGRATPARTVTIESAGWPVPGSDLRAADPDSGAEINGKIVGRDLIYQGRELKVSLLRVNLDPGREIDRSLPLLEPSGKRLIGFLIPEGLDRPGEYHAVPAVFAAKLVRNRKSMPGGKLGATFDLGSTTPRIVSIRELSAADKAGLKKGDVVLRIDDWKIRRLSDVIETMKVMTPDVAIEVEVIRGLEKKTVDLVPEAAGSTP